MVTCVALEAVTVSVEDAPAAIDVGLAVTETLGTEVPGPKLPPQPVTNARKESSTTENATERGRRGRDRGKTLFDT
jgi:hypothetical protein